MVSASVSGCIPTISSCNFQFQITVDGSILSSRRYIDDEHQHLDIIISSQDRSAPEMKENNIIIHQE